MLKVYFLICLMNHGGAVTKQSTEISKPMFDLIRHNVYVDYPKHFKAIACESYFDGKHQASWLEARSWK